MPITAAPVYLDHAATTPLRPEAIAAYAEALTLVGNPSSIHSQGQSARRMLEEAREKIAATVGCDPIEIVLTSGATESINLALKGTYWARNRDRERPLIVAPRGEHHATIDTLEWLENRGAEIEWISLDSEGRIDVDELEAVLRASADRIALVTALWANNEVGTIQPVDRIARLCDEADVPLHLDAVSAYGHLPIDFRALRSSAAGARGLVALSVSAHKVGGPVGVGALVLSRQAAVEPLVHGGGQQRQVRSGTQDVAGAISFAVAAELSTVDLDRENHRLAGLRDKLIDGLSHALPEAVVNGARGDARLSSNVHVFFPGCQGDSMLFLLDLAGISVSTGSACQAGVPEPSHVVMAMGRSEADARSVLRFTLGHTSTEADVDALLAALPAAYTAASRAGMSDRSTALGN